MRHRDFFFFSGNFPINMSDVKQQPVITQPMGTIPMSAGGNKNALNRPIAQDGKREWSYGLFDCFSACGLCCFAYWCPCMVYSRNKQHLRNLQSQGAPLPPGSEAAMDSSCCIYCGLSVCGGCGWVLQIPTREEIRERYSVRGGGCTDCLASWCCHSCSLTQERREIELEECSFQQ